MKIPFLASEGVTAPGLLDEVIPSFRRMLETRGGAVGTAISDSLVAIRDLSERKASQTLGNAKPFLDALDDQGASEAAAGLLGHSAPTNLVARGVLDTIQPFVDRLAQNSTVSGRGESLPATPANLLASLEARGSDFSALAQDGRQLIPFYLREGNRLMFRDLGLQHVTPLIDTLATQNSTLGRIAQEGFNRVLYPDHYDNAFVNGLKALNTITLMGRAAITNATQAAYPAIVAGLDPTVKAIAELSTSAGRDKLNKLFYDAGLAFDSSVSEYLNQDAGASLLQRGASTLLKATGFESVERFNRLFSGAVASNWIPQLVEQAGRGSALAVKELDRLGLRNIDALIQRGVTDDELHRGVQAFTRLTQFRVTPEELPMLASSQWGKLLFQFKGFSLKATELLVDQLSDPQRAVQTALRVGTILPLVGAPAEAFRRLVTRTQLALPGAPPPPATQETTTDPFRLNNALRDRDVSTLLKRYVEAVMVPGLGGIFYDSIKSAGYGTEGLYKMLLGPSVAQGVTLGANVLKAVNPRERNGIPVPFTDRAQPLAKQLLRDVPIIGPSLQQTYLPPPPNRRNPPQ